MSGAPQVYGKSVASENHATGPRRLGCLRVQNVERVDASGRMRAHDEWFSRDHITTTENEDSLKGFPNLPPQNPMTRSMM
jgi:hypothetical protein